VLLVVGVRSGDGDSTRGHDKEGDTTLTFLNDYFARVIVPPVRDSLETLQMCRCQIAEEFGASQTSRYVR
jgi:hypothetical protein